MTDRLTPVEMHESLDRAGLLNTAHGPGCYAIELAVPDDADAVHREWSDVHDATPDDDALGRISRATDVCYVGASKDVYARLCDHVDGEKRQAAYLEVFDPVGVVDIWEHRDPFAAEFDQAWNLARSRGWTCIVDGQVIQG
jgi:hypothetical protein